MRMVTLHYDGFDWDKGNTGKIEERVTIGTVEGFFKQRLLIKEDSRHSLSEERFLAIGYTVEERCLLVAYTIRFKGNKKLIRPISARYTHKKEEEAYEAEIKKIEKS